MYRLTFVVAVLVCAAAPARAQCCGDCNGDGAVTINELITAVNDALGSCGADTPTPQATATAPATPTPSRRPTVTPTPVPRCPFTFDDDSRNRLCLFNGRFNQGCGASLNSVFTVAGPTLVVTIDTMLSNPPTVLFAARVSGDTRADLTGWSTNNFQTINPLAGTVELRANGTELVVFPNDPPFMIQSCNFVQYRGAYLGTLNRSVGGAAGFDDGEMADALDRLQRWQERPLPDLAEE